MTIAMRTRPDGTFYTYEEAQTALIAMGYHYKPEEATDKRWPWQYGLCEARIIAEHGLGDRWRILQRA
jgi:hypothetical protein